MTSPAPSDGQKVMMRLGMLQPVKRDQMYKPMQVLYANVMKRTAFEPIHFEGWFYASESDAKAGSESNVIAKIVREQSDRAPKCENNVKYDFAEQVDRAFIHSTRGEQELQEDLNDTCHIGEKKKQPRYDEKFTHKTTYKLDAGNQAVEITYPFLDMGKDEYVADLKINSVMGQWAEYMTSMFSQAEQLKSLTFVGLYKDEPVVKISISRQQYDDALSRLQETIASHAAITFQTIGMGAKTSEAAEKEQEQFKSKTYKDALGKLPKEQVTISPKPQVGEWRGWKLSSQRARRTQGPKVADRRAWNKGGSALGAGPLSLGPQTSPQRHRAHRDGEG
jgi:hypothetical protein